MTDEASGRIKIGLECLFVLLRHRRGAAPLECDQHLFRVAAAQRAGAAEWLVVDDRDAPTCCAAAVAGHGCGSTVPIRARW